MAWDDEMVPIVRGLIMDYPDDETGDVAKYSDDRLAELILIAAQRVRGMAAFPKDYAVSITNGTMRPDPTALPRDENFINLVTLKVACMIVTAEVREFTAQGISVRDGSSAVNLQRSPVSLRIMQETYCKEFEDALFKFTFSGGEEVIGSMVVGPNYPAEESFEYVWPYGGPFEREHRG